jgi:hypothetical protein
MGKRNEFFLEIVKKYKTEIENQPDFEFIFKAK